MAAGELSTKVQNDKGNIYKFAGSAFMNAPSASDMPLPDF